MDDCGRTSAPSRPSTMPSPPSTRPSDARGRRSSGFVRESHLDFHDRLLGHEFGRPDIKTWKQSGMRDVAAVRGGRHLEAMIDETVDLESWNIRVEQPVFFAA